MEAATLPPDTPAEDQGHAPRQLTLPSFEARKVRGLQIGFAGSVDLEGYDESDIDWFNACKFGREVTFVVTGYVSERKFTGTKERVDGDVTGISDPVSRAKIDVHSIRRLADDE